MYVRVWGWGGGAKRHLVPVSDLDFDFTFNIRTKREHPVFSMNNFPLKVQSYTMSAFPFFFHLCCPFS